jgi:hypothetical protein
MSSYKPFGSIQNTNNEKSQKFFNAVTPTFGTKENQSNTNVQNLSSSSSTQSKAINRVSTPNQKNSSNIYFLVLIQSFLSIMI